MGGERGCTAQQSHRHIFSGATYRRLQILELVPQLEELGRSQEDGVEGVDHRRGKLEVFLPQQDVSHRVKDVLSIQEKTELPAWHQKMEIRC